METLLNSSTSTKASDEERNNRYHFNTQSIDVVFFLIFTSSKWCVMEGILLFLFLSPCFYTLVEEPWAPVESQMLLSQEQYLILAEER